MPFQLKQFSLSDSNCAMKIGTDGCLLGAWADVTGTKNILDIGTGCGIVALMLAQRGKAKIDAIEIDKDAYIQAKDNFAKSPWGKRLTTIHCSFQDYVKTCRRKYDLLVCSPPYFIDSLKTKDAKRRLARHTDSLSYQELISIARRLLTDEGRLCVVLPFDKIVLFRELALIEGLYINKALNIEPKKNAKPMRSLLELSLHNKHEPSETIAILDKDGKCYTKEYQSLTGAFYLSF
jgi:tRNA1Val (adenine37-N6)-methyltransferase